MYKLLFVCLGNICRSPSAENIMNHLIEQRGLADRVTCDSAGTSSYHIGSAPDRRMSAAAERNLGFPLKGQARQFVAADFANFDLILAMDRDNFEQIVAVHRTAYKARPEQVRLMCDFCTEHREKEVPDPYYGGEAGFDFVINLLTDACNGCLDQLQASGKI
jgi:protein-tyrosine phosphatase